MTAPKWRKEGIIWLPTGDQLDEEIVKICKEKEYTYELAYTWTNDYGVLAHVLDTNSDSRVTKLQQDNNPLIAKIKLLKQLIK